MQKKTAEKGKGCGKHGMGRRVTILNRLFIKSLSEDAE